ncbi:MAG: sterol desaturase family protein [Hyphomicrobium sp.]|uniref:sterol desaturase family protein n=1 Tax=Hyphomicrobium sp. TaxID=82 RepID=UPI00132C3502|nr:sterol desaturase family protein [Hyphomicrobium sp.]KAB2944124.1 MAG: sterol desaturase family protein [Hyphomicrobium sp.]MBZ0209422.1 sterol desaturase family protein [Hyphomicrobium sp.]
MPALRAIVRYGYAPFMMFGLTAAAYLIVTELVVAHDNPWAYLWLAPLLALAYATAFGAEKIAPFFEDWNDHNAHGDMQATTLHILVYEYQSIVGVVLIPVICWLFPFQGLWPTQWPMWAQLLMAFVISDFMFMVMHYISHRYPPLWRLHAVHHGVGRLYGMNGVLRHPLHQVIDMIVANAPLVIIGMPVPVAVMLGFLISITLIVQHSNVDARLGPLQKHLSIGRIHHLHHVNWGTEGDCNFGLLLTIWDRILGTFHEKPPRPIAAGDLGVDEVPNFPKGYIEQFLFPLYYKPGAGEPERYKKPAEPAPMTAAQEARRIVDAAE